jgi:drug/metabolite transporter (DMT)-like permease
VTAVLGGLGAAVAWAVSTLSTSRSTKLVSPVSVLAAVMTIGAVIAAPVALAQGIPDALGGTELAWLLASGSANLVGLLFSYSALRVGKVGVVAPINSAQGAAAAVVAMLLGERIAASSGVMLAVIVVGVVLASLSRAVETGGEHDARGALLAGIAALLFGFGLYASGRLAGELPLAWIVFVPRLLGVLVFAVPMVLLGRVRLTMAALPFVLVSGVCEIAGLAAFMLGARGSVAVTAVISSQFAALAAIVAYFAFDERLRRVQVAGVAAILVGVAVLTGLQA